MSKKDIVEKTSGLFIPAGLFIGMGLGFLKGNLVGYLLLGLGFGFLAMIIDTKLSTKNKK